MWTEATFAFSFSAGSCAGEVRRGEVFQLRDVDSGTERSPSLTCEQPETFVRVVTASHSAINRSRAAHALVSVGLAAADWQPAGVASLEPGAD